MYDQITYGKQSLVGASKQRTKELTLYKLKQKELALAVVPSKALVKLCGFSTFICPPRATKPVMMTNTSTTILKTPRTFWSHRPYLTRVPWRRKAKVIAEKPTRRRVHWPGFCWLAARRMYSPKTIELPDAQPKDKISW